MMVSDYDVIRLKVVNEMELTHREELEALRDKISKQAIEISELRKNR
jgi:hypothetical protein